MIVEIVEIGIMKSNEIRKGGFNLKATVLVDNIGTECATGEWGLSIYIEQAEKIKATGVKKIYTGHCTGGRAFRILQQELGDMVEQLKVGLVIEA